MAAELLLQAGVQPQGAAGHLLRVAPQADSFVVSTLRHAAERSLAEGAAEAAVGYLIRALDEQIDPAARAEALVELGVAERRTNGAAAADHLRAGLELLSDRSRRCAVALELGRALSFTGRIGDALDAFERALDEVDRKRDPDLYELLLGELISSAWWDAQTYPIVDARIDELDLKALHGGLGSEILLATIAHHAYRLGLHRERAIELARRALAPGTLLASGSIAFYYAVNVFARSGLLDEAVSILDQAVAQARRLIQARPLSVGPHKKIRARLGSPRLRIGSSAERATRTTAAERAGVATEPWVAASRAAATRTPPCLWGEPAWPGTAGCCSARLVRPTARPRSA
jgi:tetratricopeptide (TPR) repeat protein